MTDDAGELAALRGFADPARLRVLGSLAARPMTAAVLAAATGLPPAALTRHLDVLVAADLIAASHGAPDGAFELRIDRLNELARSLARRNTDSERAAAGDFDPGLPPEDARVLRAFVRDGRLVSIPAQESKKQVVLRHLMERCFAEDRPYPEREVNERLRAWNEDVAALRRYLVDGGYMTRAGGEYRRCSREA